MRYKIKKQTFVILFFLASCTDPNQKSEVNPMHQLIAKSNTVNTINPIFHYNFDDLKGIEGTKEICLYLKSFSTKGGHCEIPTRVSIVKRDEKNKSLRLYQLDRESESLHLIKLETPIFKDEKELYIGYWIRFSDAFDLGRGGKLPGGLLGIMKDKAYPAGGNKVYKNSGFSARSMFYTRGYFGESQDIGRFPSLYTYVYHQDMKTNYGDRESYQVNNTPIDFIRKEKDSHISDMTSSKTKYFDSGYFIVMRVKVNDAMNNNGIVEVYVNGTQVINNTKYTFSESGELGINRAVFSFFYGGDESWKPTAENNDSSYIDIDDIILSYSMINL